MHNNQLTGTLPSEWVADVTWGNLTTLSMFNNSLSGTIPASWGTPTAFPVLTEL